MRRRGACLLLALGFVALGCGSFPIEVRPELLFEQTPHQPLVHRKTGDLEVQRSGFSFLIFPVSIPNLVGAIDGAVQQSGADAVTNLEVESRVFGVVLFSWTNYIARGDLVQFE